MDIETVASGPFIYWYFLDQTLTLTPISIEIDTHRKCYDWLLSISETHWLISIDIYQQQPILIAYRNYRHVTPW